MGDREARMRTIQWLRDQLLEMERKLEEAFNLGRSAAAIYSEDAKRQWRLKLDETYCQLALQQCLVNELYRYELQQSITTPVQPAVSKTM
jgi:hypothetical protein